MTIKRTPPRPRIASQLSKIATIASESLLFKEEVTGRDFPVSFDAFAHAFLWCELGDVDRARTYQLSPKFQELCYKFYLHTQHPERPAVYSSLTELMNYIIDQEKEWRRSLGAPVPMDLAFSDTSQRAIQDSVAHRKPDISGVQSSGEITWDKISIACEYKRPPKNSGAPADPATPPQPERNLSMGSSGSGYSNPISSNPPISSNQSGGSRASGSAPPKREIQLSRYLLEMRSNQVTRDSVLGILFIGVRASFWYADSDSTLKSEFVTIDSVEFITALMCLARADPKKLGYSPHFRTADNIIFTNQPLHTARFFLDENATPGTVAYPLTDRISVARALHGRCVRVLGTCSPDIGEPCVLKLSHQVVTRDDEAKLIKRARDRGVTGIVPIYTSFVLKKLSEGPRSRLPPDMGAGFLREDREVRVLLLRRCMPLYQISDPHIFLRASISLLNTICDLFEKGDILHRDISVNNLMVEINEQSQGVLIDLDHAVDLHKNREKAASSLHRTGTLPFMALDLLHDHDDNYLHHLRHDLESFVYVLFWIAVRYKSGREVDNPAFNDWCNGSWEEIHKTKTTFLMGIFPPREMKLTPMFTSLRGGLNQLRDVLSDAHYQFSRRTSRAADGEPASIPIPYPVNLEGVNRTNFISILIRQFERLHTMGLSVHE